MTPSKFSIFKELFEYMRVRRRWFLAPFILLFVLFGIIIVFAQTSPFGPLIYTLF